jgi:PAS domain-containing protein
LHRPPRFRFAVMLLAALGAAGCELVEPDADPPYLSSVSFSFSTFGPGGVLVVDAFPEDSSYRLPRGARLPIRLETSAGDVETAGLYRAWCPARERGLLYSCFAFSLYMQQGASVTDIVDEVAASGARMQRIGVCSVNGCWYSQSLAIVWVFDPEGVIEVVRQAEDWPGVAAAEVGGGGGCIDVCPPRTYRAELRVPFPTGGGAVVAGDGVIQTAPGDTVRVFYKQPDGTTTSAWTIAS